MRILPSALLACCALLLPVAPALAGEAPVSAPAGTAPGALTFERVYASPGLNGPSPRGVRLSPDGRWLTVLRNRPDDRERYDLWGFDRTTGQWAMLVDSQRLSSGRALSEAEKMQRERMRVGDLKGIIAYEWNADSKSLLVPLDGDLLLVALDGTARRLDGVSADARDATLSPKGRYVSFVADRQFWVGEVAGGKPPVAITPAEAVAAIRQNYMALYGVEELSEQLGVTKSHLVRVFKQEMGVPPGKYMTNVRIEAVKTLLLTDEYNLDMIAGLTGFSGANYLCRVFKREVGLSPAAWRTAAAPLPAVPKLPPRSQEMYV